MIQTDLKKRTKVFSIRIIRLSKTLSTDWISITIGKQIIRCGTSVGANYRATVLAKSDKDFINKLKIVEEELDESIFWMEILMEAGIIKQAKLSSLLKEGDELLRIISASIITMKKKRKQEKKKRSPNSN